MLSSKIKKICILSLSSGILGEDMVRHELQLGLQRLKAMGLEVVFGEHALKGCNYLLEHPQERAEDLIRAFESDADMILCAIGGEDTYRLTPFLFEDERLAKALKPKVFLGFSDTTWNHFMLNKLGLKTFYGVAFLSDICELSMTMLPYTERYFQELITTGTIACIEPAFHYYKAREDFSLAAMGVAMEKFADQGFRSLRGAKRFVGKIFGGCIDSLYDFFNNQRFEDTVAVAKKYELFPSVAFWHKRILLLESSEELADGARYRRFLEALKQTGIFTVLSGVLVGKPMDNCYSEEYNAALLDVIDNVDLPIVTNLNVGHCTPRCIVPFNEDCVVDVETQKISFIHYRKAVAADLEKLCGLYAAVKQDLLKRGIDQWDELYPDKEDIAQDVFKRKLVVGDLAGRIILAYTINKECDEAYGTASWMAQTDNWRILHRLVVDPAYQGLGLAKMVLANIFVELRSEAVDFLRLDVFLNNPAACALYRNCGFSLCGYADWRKGRFALMEKDLRDDD